MRRARKAVGAPLQRRLRRQALSIRVRPYADAHRRTGAVRPASPVRPTWGQLKPALDQIWKPYLEGRGSRDDAFAELIRRTGAEPAK